MGLITNLFYSDVIDFPAILDRSRLESGFGNYLSARTVQYKLRAVGLDHQD